MRCLAHVVINLRDEVLSQDRHDLIKTINHSYFFVYCDVHKAE